MILSLIIVIGHGALRIKIMMNGTETVQRRVTEPGGMLAATTLT